MRIDEIQDSDDTIWVNISPTGMRFRDEYETLKRQHMRLSTNYDSSTSRNVVENNIDDLKIMSSKIKHMFKFCKNSSQDTETKEFLQGLRLMYNSCEEMIEELKRFL
jgi:hypothetical protein